MERALEELTGLLIGVAVLLLFGAIAALIYYALAYTIYQHRLQEYRKQAEADFEIEAARTGLDLDGEEIIRTVHAVGVELPTDGYDNIGEWATGSLFGAEEYEEVA